MIFAERRVFNDPSFETKVWAETKVNQSLNIGRYCTFVPPPIVADDSSWKNAAESFTVALTLTLGGYESAIAPNIGGWKKIINVFIECFQSGLRLLVSEWHFP